MQFSAAASVRSDVTAYWRGEIIALTHGFVEDSRLGPPLRRRRQRVSSRLL
jgi:hypothetical protein